MKSQTKRRRSSKSLSAKAERFVAEYLKDFNGTQAAIRAGYSPASARVQASQMLGNVKVAEAIREDLERVLKSSEISLERLLRQLAAIAFLDPAQLLDDSGHVVAINQMPPEVRHGLAGIEIIESRTSGSDQPAAVTQRLRLNKLGAVLALAKHFAFLTDRIEAERDDLEESGEYLPDNSDDEDGGDYDDDDGDDDDDEAEVPGDEG